MVSHTKARTQRMLQKRVLTRISGPKREEMAGAWRRLDNEELNNAYQPTNHMERCP
jgi:hypothetical protein